MRTLRSGLCFIAAALTILCSAVYALAASSPEGPFVLPGGITVREGTGIALVQDPDGGYEVRGLTAEPSARAVRAGELLEWFVCPEGTDSQVSRGEFVLRPKEIVATGDTVSFYENGTETAQATVIVMGDIIGNGILSLAQMVRLASVVAGDAPALTGPYLQAADLNGDGGVSLGDLVLEARLYTDAMQT